MGLTDNTIWTLDFAGNILAGPLVAPGIEDFEGIVQLPSGRIVAAAYNAGKLFTIDRDFDRLVNLGVNYRIGVRVSQPIGVAWDSDKNQHLIAHAGSGLPQHTEIVRLENFQDADPAVNLAALGFNPGAMTYLPDEHLMALGHRNSPAAILLFDNSGALKEQIDVSALGRLRAITYIPSTKQFAVRFASDPLLVRILSRTGTLVRTIDLSLSGINQVLGLSFFNPNHPSGGEFLMFDGIFHHTAVVTDFFGNPIKHFDYRAKLGILAASDATAITTGPMEGAFSMVDFSSSEIVVFRLE